MVFHIVIISYLLLTSNVQSLIEKVSSHVSISSRGASFQPAHPIELLYTHYTQSFFYCTSTCNVNPQCRTFVYDSASKHCTLYEGDISTGTIIPSNSSTSQIGSMVYSADSYRCYNETSDRCDFNRYIVSDSSSNVGVCPENTYWNGTMCLNQVYLGAPCISDKMCRNDLALRCRNVTNMTCIQVYEVNLIQNGDGETGSCESDYAVTAPTLWSYYGSVTQSTYTNPHATLSSSTSGPSDRGNCYFSGFFDSYTYMYQRLSLDQYSSEIDQNKVSYNFSVWTGGWEDQNDTTTLWINFYDLNNAIMGNATIGPVYAEDRQSITQLIFRQVTGMIPINTRYLIVYVAMTSTTTWNDASVDDISFKLKYNP